MRARLRSLALILCIAEAACYTYSPASLDAVAPGQTVRLRLSGEGSERLTPIMAQAPEGWGGLEDRVLEGELAERAGGSLVLEVPWAGADQDRFGTTRFRQRLVIQDSEVVSTDVRALDRLRTFVVVGGAVGVGVGVAVAALTGKSGGASRPGPGSGVDARVPPFPSFHW